MKKKSIKSIILILFGVLVISSMSLTLYPRQDTLHVGTFDSRAIAVAYARSEVFNQNLSNMREKYNKAKEEGNETIVKELEHLGPTMQQVMHQQGFSIASVADILEKVKADLPKIAQEAGVDIIVSKWEVVYNNPSIEIVDVTSYLVMLFNPDENTLKTIENLRQKAPIPLLELLLELPGEK
jgi:Skp family chaperone for outer membrane proteins